MRFCLILGSLVIATTALAQMPEGPGRPGLDRPPQRRSESLGLLEGIRELRFIITRLGLEGEQREHAEGLIDEYKAYLDEAQADILAIEKLARQRKELRDAGKLGEAQEIEDQMRALMPDRIARQRFLDGLRQILDEEQQEDLGRVLEFLERSPTGQVTTVDIYRVARGMQLSAAQRQALDEAHRAHREDVAKTRNPLYIENTMPQIFERRVREILTPEQVDEFVRRLNMLGFEEREIPEPQVQPPTPMGSRTAPPRPSGPGTSSSE